MLSSQIGFDVAETLLEGFDRHYRVFRDAAIARRRGYSKPATGTRCSGLRASASRRTMIRWKSV
ncbi:MAG: Isocitrate dehydrogenase phosphatase (EC /kinase (EC [uncultured Caballeronia sp.]|nr:MAG: Isocitrate dehydrogenase phosphatase (EC /kinase (EC [uncultured Caballeronia sp.]